MATIETSYLGELRTEATHLKSGIRIITDAPTDNEGKGEAFSPTDLLAASLGSCMMTLMGIRSRKKGIHFSECRMDITKIMAANPRRVSEIHIVIDLSGQHFTDEEKSELEDAALNCPVALSIHPNIRQQVEFKYAN
ncbi:MAG: OsmC family protein [Flavobacteriales bacterium]|nr:OsmC family protein [Flavobacteriales bacterium]MCB9447179.1 OsmC family protein [Flavobacteriales bacterium]